MGAAAAWAAGVGCTPAADPLTGSGPASLEEAQRFVLTLVNRDREQSGLQPVRWDESAARAARRHAEDMARLGFTGHWGSDGSVPEQRYCEAGGEHMVQENAACFFDGTARELDPNPAFDLAALTRIQSAFINEIPPHDGHRNNILKPTHNAVGVGLAKPLGISQPCMAQEFVDRYGSYAPLPRAARIGARIRVAGEVAEPIEFGGIGLARVEPARSIPVDQLLRGGTYHVPEPYAMFFPAGYETPQPVQLTGRRFSIDLVLDDQGRPGRYQVSVWGKHPGNERPVMVSLRTIVVR